MNNIMRNNMWRNLRTDVASFFEKEELSLRPRENPDCIVKDIMNCINTPRIKWEIVLFNVEYEVKDLIEELDSKVWRYVHQSVLKFSDDGVDIEKD